MNSPNKEASDMNNNEANKFPIVDRYMLDNKGWGTTLEEIKKSRKT
jgi:hypothetical protein